MKQKFYWDNMKNIFTIRIKWWLAFLIFILFSSIITLLEIFIIK